ncbi:hypothetical protein LJK87_17690 [Paenibacillus sp. P25]|nr:hypothetical protein LJK87_17690 [Paenibacillus sp. P25]
MSSAPEESAQLPARLGLNRERYGQLLVSVMASVTNRKKVYIALEGDPVQAESDARRLMKLVYESLPYAFRRRLGVLTFAGEPDGKEHIHVTFVEKSALKQGERQPDRETLLDWSGGAGAGGGIRTDRERIPVLQMELLTASWKRYGGLKRSLHGFVSCSNFARRRCPERIPAGC